MPSSDPPDDFLSSDQFDRQQPNLRRTTYSLKISTRALNDGFGWAFPHRPATPSDALIQRSVVKSQLRLDCRGVGCRAGDSERHFLSQFCQAPSFRCSRKRRRAIFQDETVYATCGLIFLLCCIYVTRRKIWGEAPGGSFTRCKHLIMNWQ